MNSNLENCLMKDDEFLQKIQDLKFAHAAYLTFCNREWINGTGDRWSCSWRYAGGLVAQARNVGESYLDFYLRDLLTPELEPVEEDYAAFFAILVRLGWREVTIEDEIRDGQRILQILDSAEEKPEGPKPDWFKVYELPEGRKHDENTLLGRIDRAAEKGVIDQAEYLWMRTRAFLSPEAIEKIS